jgi:hypothetical protein
MVPAEKVVGDYANAFRVVHDSGTEWFLDFLVFSESEKQARVVSRVRVQERFIRSIQDRLSETLRDISVARTSQAPGPVLMS